MTPAMQAALDALATEIAVDIDEPVEDVRAVLLAEVAELSAAFGLEAA